jgi:hypothetical protein
MRRISPPQNMALKPAVNRQLLMVWLSGPTT